MPTAIVTLPDGRKVKLSNEDKDALMADAQALEQQYIAEQQQQPEPEPEPESGGIGRALGLTGRYAVEGAMALPGMAAGGIGRVLNLITPGDYFETDYGRAVSNTLTEAGLPQPSGAAEEFSAAISRGLAGGAVPIGAGQALAGSADDVVRGAANMLRSNPGAQAAATVSGMGAGELARQGGAGPGTQVAATLAGSLVPSGASAALQGAGRLALRGGEAGRQAVEGTLDDFARAGTTPTVGQATQGRGARAVESTLSRTPGGAGPIARKAESLADDISQRIDEMSDQLARRVDPAKAGRAIKRGVKEAFLPEYRATGRALYRKADDLIPGQTPVQAQRFKAALDDVAEPIEGAEEVAGVLSNSVMRRLRDAFQNDAPDGVLSYEALRAIRSRIGARLNTFSLADDIPRGELKRIYGALSDDLMDAAAAQGDDAVRATTRANNYWKAGQERIEAIEAIVKRKGGGEKIFQSSMSGTREGASTLKSIMQSLPQDGRKMVAAAVLRRMGRAVPSQQDATGQAFSIQTFLTNWAKLSPEARGALFNRMGPKFNANINAISRVAANFREGSQVLANPSGTAQAGAAITGAATLGGALASGNMTLAGYIMAGIGGSNVLGRMMTNPKTVQWLANATKLPPGMYASQVNLLAQKAEETGDIELAEIAQALAEQAPQEQ